MMAAGRNMAELLTNTDFLIQYICILWYCNSKCLKQKGVNYTQGLG
jgi:hypothetical protein